MPENICKMECLKCASIILLSHQKENSLLTALLPTCLLVRCKKVLFFRHSPGGILCLHYFARGWYESRFSRRYSLLRCVYISVVVMDSWPSISCTALRSAPPSTRCVAKL